MGKRQIFDQVSDMEKQIGELYEQLGDLKGQLSGLLEENHRLVMENRHLRDRFDNTEKNKSKTQDDQATQDLSGEEIPGEGYDNLARLYEEGFHICNVHFGSPREDEDCLFCLLFLNKAK